MSIFQPATWHKFFGRSPVKPRTRQKADPILWTNGKVEVGRVREEKMRRKKIREEKNNRRKKMQVRKKRRNTVCFPMFCGSWGGPIAIHSFVKKRKGKRTEGKRQRKGKRK